MIMGNQTPYQQNKKPQEKQNKPIRESNEQLLPQF